MKNNIEVIITGCILFKGQGLDNTRIVELSGIDLVDSDKIDDFIDDYEVNGGDSYMVLSELTECIDTNGLEVINSKISELKNELVEIKNNGILISNIVDNIYVKLDLLHNAKKNINLV